MGKTKIKVIDDSNPEKESKKSIRKLGRQDELVEKLKAELGIKGEISEKKETSTSKTRIVVDDSAVKPISAEKGMTESSKTQKPGKSKPRSKKYQQSVKDLDRTKTYPIDQALDMVKKLSYAKFNGTLEAHINTGQTGIRGLVSLPYANGRKLRILVFGHLPSPEEYEGIVFGDDSTIEEINKGKVNFDLVITTPEWMPHLAKVAKILGPRGLMPNPKNGTIVSNDDGLKKTVEGFQAGKTEYGTEPKAPIIHLALGKLNQPNEELAANVKILLSTLGKTRIKKVSLSPTMGPSVRLDLASI